MSVAVPVATRLLDNRRVWKRRDVYGMRFLSSSREIAVIQGVLLLLLGLAGLLLSSCAGGRGEVPPDFKRVGIYDEERKKMKYLFSQKKNAERLSAQIDEQGRESLIVEIEAEGQPAYRVYVREPQPRSDDLKWPRPPEPTRIRYVGLLEAKLGGSRGLLERFFGEDRPKVRYVRGVAADRKGKVYVSHAGGVMMYDTVNGKIEAFMPDVNLSHPAGLDVGPEGRLFVADSLARRVFVFDGMKLVAQIGTPHELRYPYGLAVDRLRRVIYVTDLYRNALIAYDFEGRNLFVIESKREVAAKPEEGFSVGDVEMVPGEEVVADSAFGSPADVAVNSKGEIFLVDQGGAKINVYSPEGTFLRRFGGSGSAPGFFVRPKSVAVDAEDNVYVVDAAFDNMQVFTGDGDLLLVVGKAGRTAGSFQLPTTVAVSPLNVIFVADRGTHRIQVFQYLGATAGTAELRREQPQ